MSNISERIDYLISRDSKGKIRVVEISYKWDESQHGFIIYRTTGILGGKMTEQPNILIQRGKASRTTQQQVELEYNSNKKKYLDKGYKSIDSNPEKYSVEELETIIGSVITNTNNVPRPQLAKQADKVTNKKVFDKSYLGSRKIDGLRCLIYMGEDGELHTASRGAMNYDAAMIQILDHPTLIKLFENNPGLILDGECYKHGLSLQQINSVARTQVTAVDYSVLQFYWYDIVDLNTTAEERANRINEIANELNLGFDPNRVFEDGELRIQVVPQEEISGWDNMEKLHNQYVSEGWEGLVIRLKSAVYGPNKRTNDMLKIKMYKQDTYKVIGIAQGLREYDDMVFILETEDGKEFKAKPFGDRNQKIEYTNNFEEKYKGHLGDVKYFYYSDDNCPLQPSFVAFRPDLE